ncbi:MAG: CRISPR system precrRNA processing endoribonuclease RAMP protein Cas6 [Nitrococcus sp.]|nr:CRISPR system precrRNA processing endoribonuclease RAMP protein Cas6 [Nitrococcus sp.]
MAGQDWPDGSSAAAADSTRAPLPIARYRLRFIGCSRNDDLTGSLWRSAFGKALRESVCITGLPTCTACLLRGECPYPALFEPYRTLFESYAGAHALPFHLPEDVPRPYILAPDDDADGSGEYTLALTLVGEAARRAGIVRFALERAAAAGLGRQRWTLTPRAIERWCDERGVWATTDAQDGSATLPAVPLAPRVVRLVLKTPLRLRVQGGNLQPWDLSAEHFGKALVLRLSLLAACYAPQSAANAAAAMALAALPALDWRPRQLEWQEASSYSARQQQEIPLGGIRGEILLGGSGLRRLWPWLWIGQWVHVGKMADRGHGRYELLAMDC